MTTQPARKPRPTPPPHPPAHLSELTDLTLIDCRPDGPVVHRHGRLFPGYTYGRLLRRNAAQAPEIIERITHATHADAPDPEDARPAGTPDRAVILRAVLGDALQVHARHPATPFPLAYRSALTALFDTLGLNRFNDPRRHADVPAFLSYLDDHLAAVDAAARADVKGPQVRAAPPVGNLPPPWRK